MSDLGRPYGGPELLEFFVAVFVLFTIVFLSSGLSFLEFIGVPK
jgi:hypothetical protein